jgi:RNA polymerase sigma factor for flagellar operon FliA
MANQVASRCRSEAGRTLTSSGRVGKRGARTRTARLPNMAATAPSDRDAMAADLLPLVRRVAFEMHEHLPSHVEVDDLIGAGILGLLDAVRRFDASKHVKIETYARHRIRGAILDSLRGMDTASRDMRRKNKHAERVYRSLEVKLGRAADDSEMAEALGISLKKWYRTVQELQAMGVDWLRPMHTAETEAPEVDNLPARGQDDQLELCYRREQRDIVAQAIQRLSERERTVISLYYTEEMTMKQIGEQLGIDESRVSQLHSAAVAHLKKRVQALLRPTRRPLKLAGPPDLAQAAREQASYGVPQESGPRRF